MRKLRRRTKLLLSRLLLPLLMFMTRTTHTIITPRWNRTNTVDKAR